MRAPGLLDEGPAALEGIEIAFDEFVIDPRRGIVEAVFLGPLDGRIFDQCFPARDDVVGMPDQDRYRFDVRHELREAFLILGELVHITCGRVDRDAYLDKGHRLAFRSDGLLGGSG